MDPNIGAANHIRPRPKSGWENIEVLFGEIKRPQDHVCKWPCGIPVSRKYELRLATYGLQV